MQRIGCFIWAGLTTDTINLYAVSITINNGGIVTLCRADGGIPIQGH